MAYVTPGTVAAGDVATAAAWNVLVGDIIALPRGIMAYKTSSSNTITSNVITGLNTTVTFEAGRSYRLAAHISLTTNASSRIIGTIDIAGYTSNVRPYDMTGASGEFASIGAQYELIAAPGAGSKAVTVNLTQISGTSNMAGAADALHWLLIEDIGLTPA